MIDLHRHDEHSLFDGFGKASDLAQLAKEKGYTALGISNHGSTSGLVEHYFSCKDVGIKPILGVEAYFQPKFDKEKDKYHLCLFVKNLTGYQNLNKILAEATINNFYYKPTVDFKLLEKYSEGLICTSACIANILPQLLLKEKNKLANKVIKKFISIFGDDFYIEIQPYKLKEKNLQEKANIALINLAHKYKVKCILTSDSHYGSKEDFSTYLKMHEISGTKYDVGETYYERYMPEVKELGQRFIKMHKNDFVNVKSMAKEMYKNLKEIENKTEDEILEKLEIKIPHVTKNTKNAKKILKNELIKGLKQRGKYNKKYLERIKQEYEILVYHGFENYFLIVQDYVLWAKKQGIKVGPGRGSVCNSLVAYALGITDVDPVYFDLDFTRFLRKDKKKLPDIDLDFETSRRHEVIDYIVEKYKGKAIQICSYGLYKVDNLLNDLFKVCGVTTSEEKANIKNYVKKYINDDTSKFDYEGIKNKAETKYYNKTYDNILVHFNKLYKQIRFLGTHAAGVAIVDDDILNYTTIRRSKDIYTSAYDLNNLEKINVIKFDILGLKTMSIIKELEDITDEHFEYTWLDDALVKEQFKCGNTNGIFQFEKKAAKNILQSIEADCIEDVIVANALNRPGPLSLGMPEQYANNKKELERVKNNPYFKYTKETYGTVVYQEQIMAICRGIGNMSWEDTDKVLKHLKGTQMTEKALEAYERDHKYLLSEFTKGAKKNGFTEREVEEIFEAITVYSFNKGHATGYTLISWQMMWYKVYYPTQFWYVCLKYASNDADLMRYKIDAVKEENIILLPHVNRTANYSITKLDGELALQEGLISIKNVGEKAAIAIEAERKKNGIFKNIDDFIDRVPKRVVNARVVNALLEAGALEFNKKKYISRVKKYNSTLYMKGMR